MLRTERVVLTLSETTKRIVMVENAPGRSDRRTFLRLGTRFRFVSGMGVIVAPRLIEASCTSVITIPKFSGNAFETRRPKVSGRSRGVMFSRRLKGVMIKVETVYDKSIPTVLVDRCAMPKYGARDNRARFLARFRPIVARSVLLTTSCSLITLNRVREPRVVGKLEGICCSKTMGTVGFGSRKRSENF